MDFVDHDKPSSDDSGSDGSFRFSSERQIRIFNRLNKLVSPGIAEYFRDACQLIEIQNKFTTATHLIAHLLREIESAITKVLRPIEENRKEKSKNQRKTTPFSPP